MLIDPCHWFSSRRYFRRMNKCRFWFYKGDRGDQNSDTMTLSTNQERHAKLYFADIDDNDSDYAFYLGDMDSFSFEGGHGGRKSRWQLCSMLKSIRNYCKSQRSPPLLAMSASSTTVATRSDTQSNHFSVTTDRKYSYSRHHVMECTDSKQVDNRLLSNKPPLVPPNKKSQQEKLLFLRSLIDEKRKTSVIGDISTCDSASVGSKRLGVSYDDNYAQLVLKTSSSDATEDDDSVVLNELLSFDGYLGATFPHPAAPINPRKVKAEKTPCNWLYRFEIALDGDPLEDHDRVVETKESDWELGWSFSRDDSVISFSSILGTIQAKSTKNLFPHLCGWNDFPYDEPRSEKLVSFSSPLSMNPQK